MSMLDLQLSGQLGAFFFHADLQLKDTGILGVFGDSGSGKTLLLRSIAGLEPSLEGRVVVQQHTWLDTEGRISLPTYQRKVGYVFQEPRLLPHLTAAENLSFALQREKKTPSKIRQNEVLDCLNLTNCLDRYPRQLSGGQQQRVAIARAALSHPDLLLMDEPLSGLDEALKDSIMEMIKHLAEACDLPIIYVSHHYSEIARLAHHVTFVREGQYSPVMPITKIFDVPYDLIGRDVPNVLFGHIKEVHPELLIVETALGDLFLDNFGGFQVSDSVRVMIPLRDLAISGEDSLQLGAVTYPAMIQAIQKQNDEITGVLLTFNQVTLMCSVPAARAACLHLNQSVFVSVKQCYVSIGS